MRRGSPISSLVDPHPPIQHSSDTISTDWIFCVGAQKQNKTKRKSSVPGRLEKISKQTSNRKVKVTALVRKLQERQRVPLGTRLGTGWGGGGSWAAECPERSRAEKSSTLIPNALCILALLLSLVGTFLEGAFRRLS